MKWPGPFSLFKQLKKSILFKAKTIIIKSFLSLISAIVCTSIVLIFFQNCGRYNAGSASSGGSSLTVPSIIDEELRAKDVAPLNCNNQNSVAAGPPIESSQFIKAYGVMNGTNNGEYNNFSYIDQMNRAIGLDIQLKRLIELDPGQKYKWIVTHKTFYPDSILFASKLPPKSSQPKIIITESTTVFCGVTLSGIVKCSKIADSKQFVEFDELPGAEQASIVYDQELCVLRNGVVSCINSDKEIFNIQIPEKIVLLDGPNFVGESGIEYNLPRDSHNITIKINKSLVPNSIKLDENSPSFNLCGIKVKTASLIATDNFLLNNKYGVTYRGCSITVNGKLICIDTVKEKNILQNKSLGPDGNLSNELGVFDSQKKYLSVKNFFNRFFCAVAEDFEVSCFSLGYASAYVPLVKAANLQATYKKPEQSEVFKDIEDLKYNENKKNCILKQKKIFCSKLPLVDINNSKTNNFYQLDSSYSFKQLLNFTRKSSFASSNDNVCALTEEGRLMCESSQILSNGNKKLIDQDLGTIYNQFISDSKWLCGQTIQNETRCAKFINENSDVNLNFSKIPDFEYVGRAGEVFFGANQKFIKISAVRNINEPFSSHYQLQFKSNIEESSEFFLATNGKIYIAASMDGVLTETSAENLNLFKNMQFLRSSGLFFDAQSQIIYSYNRSFQYNVEKILLSSTTNSKKISFLISDSLAIDEDGYLVGEGVGNLTFIKQQTISYNP